MKINFDSIIHSLWKVICSRYRLFGLFAVGIAATMHQISNASELIQEPVQACVIPPNTNLTPIARTQIARCLGWQEDKSIPLCRGFYEPTKIEPLTDNEIRIAANEVSFLNQGRSELTGNVVVQQNGRVVNAQTAYVYRDAKTNKVTQIELLGKVRYMEEGKLMVAKKVRLNPENKSGQIEDVLYRLNIQRASAIQPAWGRASLVERFPNEDYLLKKATYTTCTPQDEAWQIEADSIKLNHNKSFGIARNARLRVHNWPILYTPYLTFPTSKERKSGFLMPVVGSSNVGGFNVAIPYYWNIAPNYDLTFVPQIYSDRGFMMGEEFRFLTRKSFGLIRGRFMPHDRRFQRFLEEHRENNPILRGKSSDRWAVQVQDDTSITPDLHFKLNLQQVSDDYFLQDFQTNLALITERQLLRQGDLSYTTRHWTFEGMLRSYQTLHPISETPVSDSYQQLPQLRAFGEYDGLWFNSNFSLLGQFDYFKWPSRNRGLEFAQTISPDAGRFHLNPLLTFPHMHNWGYITPTVQLVENNYQVGRAADPDRTLFNPLIAQYREKSEFNRLIPRYNVDGGLYFERYTTFNKKEYTQTLEPRLFYLYVPYYNQTQIPVFDSGYMIFNYDQLFRTNRFSGFDRIGDANQLSYALATRWLPDEGEEKASLSIGQAHYFANRKVQLCQRVEGNCEDDPITLGLLSRTAKFSPLTSRGQYHFNLDWVLSADYVWNPSTRATNNGHVNFHYQPASNNNKIIGLGYTYLVNGDNTQVGFTRRQDDSLHQATISYAWPLSEKWSTLGAYNFNISKGYEMMSFFGVQYDNCCWALRFMGGRTFRNLDASLRPQYNNNFFLQILLKGLGSVGNSDPSSRIRTFIAGYNDIFHS